MNAFAERWVRIAGTGGVNCPYRVSQLARKVLKSSTDCARRFAQPELRLGPVFHACSAWQVLAGTVTRRWRRVAASSGDGDPHR
jgi:hypothetical protein